MRWSFSAWNCYNQCPAKYKFRYKDRLRLGMKSVAAERGDMVHASAERYLVDPINRLESPMVYYESFLTALRDKGAKPEHTIILNREWKPAMPWEDEWLKAILDVALVEGTVARNYDWKTGKIYPDHVDQRELYSLAQLCAYPEVEVAIGMHVYVDLKQNRVSEFKQADVPALKAKWEERVSRLVEDEIFPTNPSFTCRYCEYSKWNGGPCRF